jgi:hypothetical protein
VQPLVSQEQADRARAAAQQHLLEAVGIAVIVALIAASRLWRAPRRTSDTTRPVVAAPPKARAPSSGRDWIAAAVIFVIGGLVLWGLGAHGPGTGPLPPAAPCGADRACIHERVTRLGQIAKGHDRPEVSLAAHDLDGAIGKGDCEGAQEPIERLTRLATNTGTPPEDLRRSMLDVWNAYCGYCRREEPGARASSPLEAMFCAIADE